MSTPIDSAPPASGVSVPVPELMFAPTVISSSETMLITIVNIKNCYRSTIDCIQTNSPATTFPLTVVISSIRLSKPVPISIESFTTILRPAVSVRKYPNYL